MLSLAQRLETGLSQLLDRQSPWRAKLKGCLRRNRWNSQSNGSQTNRNLSLQCIATQAHMFHQIPAIIQPKSISHKTNHHAKVPPVCILSWIFWEVTHSIYSMHINFQAIKKAFWQPLGFGLSGKLFGFSASWSITSKARFPYNCKQFFRTILKGKSSNFTQFVRRSVLHGIPNI